LISPSQDYKRAYGIVPRSAQVPWQRRVRPSGRVGTADFRRRPDVGPHPADRAVRTLRSRRPRRHRRAAQPRQRAVLIWGAVCQGGRVKRRPGPSSRPPLHIGQVSCWGVVACRCRRVVSLKCAGWLPQDGTFESELAAGLEIERDPLRCNGIAHSTDADHSKTLADTFAAHLDGCGGLLSRA